MEKTKSMCGGCRKDMYNNGGVCGNTKECWSYKTAKVENKKRLHINQCPLFDNIKSTPMLSCYYDPQYVFINKEEEENW